MILGEKIYKPMLTKKTELFTTCHMGNSHSSIFPDNDKAKDLWTQVKVGTATLGRQLCWRKPHTPESSRESWLLLHRGQLLPPADSTSPMPTSLLLPSGTLQNLCLHSPSAVTAPSCWLQIHTLTLSPLVPIGSPMRGMMSLHQFIEITTILLLGRVSPQKIWEPVKWLQLRVPFLWPTLNLKAAQNLPFHITELLHPWKRNTYRADFLCPSIPQTQLSLSKSELWHR